MKTRGYVVRAQAELTWGASPGHLVEALAQELGSYEAAEDVVREAITERSWEAGREAALHGGPGLALLVLPPLVLAWLAAETGVVASPSTPEGLAALLCQAAGGLVLVKALARLAVGLRGALSLRLVRS